MSALAALPSHRLRLRKAAFSFVTALAFFSPTSASIGTTLISSASTRLTTEALKPASSAKLASATTASAKSALFTWLHIQQFKIDRMIVHIHASNAHLDAVTESVYFRSTFTNQRMLFLMMIVVIIGQITQTN
ncbi:hypothetical protein D3C71_1698410 [compost metagenome]